MLNGCSFRSLLFNGNPSSAKLGTGYRNTLLSPKHNLHSIAFRDALSPLMEFVVSDAAERLGE